MNFSTYWDIGITMLFYPIWLILTEYLYAIKYSIITCSSWHKKHFILFEFKPYLHLISCKGHQMISNKRNRYWNACQLHIQILIFSHAYILDISCIYFITCVILLLQILKRKWYRMYMCKCMAHVFCGIHWNYFQLTCD